MSASLQPLLEQTTLALAEHCRQLLEQTPVGGIDRVRQLVCYMGDSCYQWEEQIQNKLMVLENQADGLANHLTRILAEQAV